MGTCYICGKQHVDYRRTVYTGNSYRTGISSRGSIHSSVASHTGVRTVCARCAFNIDYEAHKSEGAWGPILGVLLIFISLVLLIINSVLGVVGIIGGVLLCIFPRKKGKENAQLWYNQNVDKYVDEVDLKAQQYQLQVEQAQIEQKRKREEQYQNEQRKILEDKIQIKELGKIFTERLTQEKDLLITKVQVYNKKFQKIEILNSDEIKKLIKELEDQEVDCEKTLKKINKICDDYIKQCRNSLSNKSVIEESIKNIEQIRNILLNLVNQFVSGIKNTENHVLRASLEISDNNHLICENDIIDLDIKGIDNSILLIESSDNSSSEESQSVSSDTKNLTEDEKKIVYMKEYINDQLNRTDSEEIQRMEDMYFNTSSLSYFKNTIPSYKSFNSIDEYKNKLREILKVL